LPPRPSRLNPPVTALGRHNAVLGGLYPSAGDRRSPDRQVVDFNGPLSLKVVLRGLAEWHTARQRYLVDAGFCLVLNRGQTYSLTFEPTEPVETFCPFFANGFVEDAARSLASSDEVLLDEPQAAARPFVLEPHVRPLRQDLATPLHRLRRLADTAQPSDLAWDGTFVALSLALVRSATGWRTELSRASRRATTRAEITKRLGRARDFIHGEADQRIALSEIAAVACLSPHHFHRLFTAAFQMTPAAYVTELRLARAARRLAATDMSVTDVCLTVGFESLGSFSARFRRSFGVSPAAWRRIARSEKPARAGLA
jgi:AraC family transcriptional regulator